MPKRRAQKQKGAPKGPKRATVSATPKAKPTFDVVVVTCCHERQCTAIRKELARRPEFDDVVALAVSDPHSRRVGSGGGTLNALIEAAKALTRKQRGLPADSDVEVSASSLADAKVCIIHSGGDSQRSPTQSVCGKAWSWLNTLHYAGNEPDGGSAADGDCDYSRGHVDVGGDDATAAQAREASATLSAPFDLLFRKMCACFADSPAGGMVVASCDVLLLMPEPPAVVYDWSKPGVTGLAIPAELAIGPNHGVFNSAAASVSNAAADAAADADGGGADAVAAERVGDDSVMSKTLEGDLVDGDGSGHDPKALSMKRAPAAGALPVPAVEVAAQPVKCYMQKPSIAQLRSADAVMTDKATGAEQVPIDTGVLHFDAVSTGALLQLCSQAPFTDCTTAGTKALRIELYSDIMLAFATGSMSDATEAADRAAFLDMPSSDADAATCRRAREMLWKTLHPMRMYSIVPPSPSKFGHLGTTAELLHMMAGFDADFARAFALRPMARSFVKPPKAARRGVTINSIVSGDTDAAVGTHAVVEHCELHGCWSLGEACLLSGLRLRRHVDQANTDGSTDGVAAVPAASTGSAAEYKWRWRVPDNAAVQETALVDGRLVLACFGVADKIKEHYRSAAATIAGKPWSWLLESTGATPDDIWPGVPENKRNLWSARIFGTYRESLAADLASGDAVAVAAAKTGASPSMWLLHTAKPSAATSRAWLAADRCSFESILARADVDAELKWRQGLAHRIGSPKLGYGITLRRRVALVTGATGQDGSYLLELLLDKGYEVHGVMRRCSSFNTARIDHLYRDDLYRDRFDTSRLSMHYADLTDPTNLVELVARVRPDEIYNLAAQSHVKVSFLVAEDTASADGVGVLRLLNAIRTCGLERTCRFYQASTSELYGKVQAVPQDEETPFYPRSPYAVAKQFAFWTVVNYREAYGMHLTNGILFNHESPRRGETFVTRKITRAVAAIHHGTQDVLYLGNIDAKRDWGHARDYVECMWRMLQEDKPDDFVIATGETHTVREFIEKAFAHVGTEIEWRGPRGTVDEVGVAGGSDRVLVRIDPKYFRPTEVELLLGNPAKAKRVLGWTPKVTFEALVNEMMEHDLKPPKKMSVS